MKKWIRVLVGIVIGAVFLYLTLRRIEWDEVSHALAEARWQFIPLAILFLAIGYALRILRWWYVLKLAGVNVAPRVCAAPFLIGFALNNVLPFRAGDIVRCVGFAQRLRASVAQLIGTLVVERFLDLSALLIYVLAGLSVLPEGKFDHRFILTAQILGGGAVLFLVVMVLFAGPIRRLTEAIDRHTHGKESLLHKILRAAGQILGTLAMLQSPAKALLLIVMSVVVWFFEGGLFAMVGMALRLDVAAGAYWFSMGWGTVATLIPGTPGNVGTFDYFATQAMQGFDVDPSIAATYAILVHVLLWVPITLVGGLMMLATGYRATSTPVAVTNTISSN